MRHHQTPTLDSEKYVAPPSLSFIYIPTNSSLRYSEALSPDHLVCMKDWKFHQLMKLAFFSKQYVLTSDVTTILYCKVADSYYTSLSTICL